MRASPPFRAGFWLGLQLGAIAALCAALVVISYVKAGL